MVELLCACGDKKCPNNIRIHQPNYLLVEHKIGGKELLMYTSSESLRLFAKAILKAYPAKKNRTKRKKHA